jgi:hypothetical protein
MYQVNITFVLQKNKPVVEADMEIILLDSNNHNFNDKECYICEGKQLWNWTLLVRTDQFKCGNTVNN